MLSEKTYLEYGQIVDMCTAHMKMCSRILKWQHFFNEHTEEEYFGIKAFKNYLAILGD